MRLIMRGTLLSFLLLTMACRHQAASQLSDDGSGRSTHSAVTVWSNLQESTATGRPITLYVYGSDEPLQYGAEKEGSSSLITRLLGPKPDYFREIVFSLYRADQTKFMQQFLTGMATGELAEANVVDAQGRPIQPDFRFLQGKNFVQMSYPDLKSNFELWLGAAGERPFSFINPEYRQKIFLGHAAGMGRKRRFKEYERFIVNHGPGENYVIDALKDGAKFRDIWEIRFKPQKSYGEFHAMINWFRESLQKFVVTEDGQETLKVEGELFDAPGHQRVSFYNPSGKVDAELAKIQEVIRNIQAFIVLSEIAGQTGLLTSKHKYLYNDHEIMEWSEKKGLIRLEKDKFGEKILSIEFRVGTKTEETRTKAQHWLSTYAASRDLGHLASVNSWQLIPPDFDRAMSADALARRFGVSQAEAKKFITNMKNSYNELGRFTKFDLTVPIWYWENAPYLSPAKKALLKRLTADFIRDIAARNTPRHQDVSELLSAWSRSSQLRSDIDRYLTPEQVADAKTIEFRSSGPIDVNKIDLGLEYSARFSLLSKSEFSEEEILGKKRYIRTIYDLSPEEREATIRDYAEQLRSRIYQGQPPQVPLHKVQQGHGHNLSIAYEFQDPAGRTWRVEWDGIGRSYDENGRVVPGTERGGHVEVVTPKGGNAPDEIRAVFDSFRSANLIPAQRAGGGHISVDLAPFEGQPAKMARFLALFNQHQGMISFLFQDMNRLRSAAPHVVSKELQRALVDFKGSETSLKQLLYNERYFNTRLGRKTRYSTIDMALYFQDVIPAEFITAEYDFNNPLEKWRRTFRVNPNVRKMELRLFDAPRTTHEAYLQIKFIRAMLDYALNTNKPIQEIIEPFDHMLYASRPEYTEKVCSDFLSKLGLDFSEYKTILHERIASLSGQMRKKNFVPWVEKLEANRNTTGWGEALAEARPPERALKSSERPVESLTPTEQERVFKDAVAPERKIDAIRATDQARIERENELQQIQQSDKYLGPCRRINAQILKIIPIGKMRY